MSTTIQKVHAKVEAFVRTACMFNGLTFEDVPGRLRAVLTATTYETREAIARMTQHDKEKFAAGDETERAEVRERYGISITQDLAISQALGL